ELAKRCLSAEQSDRFADAGELADAVAELRRQAEQRARQAELDNARAQAQAELEKAQARLQAEEEKRAAEQRVRDAELAMARAQVQADEQRKRRRLSLVGAGVLIAVLLAGVAGTTAAMFRAQRAREEEANHRRDAEDARRQASKRHHLALRLIKQQVFGPSD